MTDLRWSRSDRASLGLLGLTTRSNVVEDCRRNGYLLVPAKCSGVAFIMILSPSNILCTPVLASKDGSQRYGLQGVSRNSKSSVM